MDALTDDHHGSGAHGGYDAKLADKEMYRWMTGFGLPMLLVAVFTGLAFGFQKFWLIGPAVVVLISSIFALVYLTLTTDLNEKGDGFYLDPHH